MVAAPSEYVPSSHAVDVKQESAYEVRELWATEVDCAQPSFKASFEQTRIIICRGWNGLHQIFTQAQRNSPSLRHGSKKMSGDVIQLRKRTDSRLKNELRRLDPFAREGLNIR